MLLSGSKLDLYSVEEGWFKPHLIRHCQETASYAQVVKRLSSQQHITAQDANKNTSYRNVGRCIPLRQLNARSMLRKMDWVNILDMPPWRTLQQKSRLASTFHYSNTFDPLGLKTNIRHHDDILVASIPVAQTECLRDFMKMIFGSILDIH